MVLANIGQRSRSRHDAGCGYLKRASHWLANLLPGDVAPRVRWERDEVDSVPGQHPLVADEPGCCIPTDSARVQEPLDGFIQRQHSVGSPR